MLEQIIADVLLIIHLCFIGFVVFGGFLLIRWNWMFLFHRVLPSAPHLSGWAHTFHSNFHRHLRYCVQYSHLWLLALPPQAATFKVRPPNQPDRLPALTAAPKGPFLCLTGRPFHRAI